jgi:histidinol dehydrogenase
MKIIKKKKDINAFMKTLGQRSMSPKKLRDVRKVVEKVISDVRRYGDRAVRKYTERFDRVKLKDLSIPKSEIDTSVRQTESEFLDALKESARRIRVFHEFQKEHSWYFSDSGMTLGQIIRPLQRVGVYVPGGMAYYPSTVLMNVIPAQVAGVKEIVLCVPCHDDVINPYVAAAVKLLRIKEVYRIGGAQAIAAMAYGTETIKRVDKIAGPGNIYVAMAKKMVFGDVGIDMIAGPSEILIMADEHAHAEFIASDLLGQAEHDEMASAILITDSKILADEVKREITKQLKTLKRKEIVKRSLNTYGAIIITDDLIDAVEIANQIAPEHLEIMARAPGRYLSGIKNAGAIFVGEWSPETLGDYVAGPNHTLPTGGTARFSSPLGVYDFLKRTSIIHGKKESFKALSDIVERFADIEGLEAHGNTIRVRRGKI